MVNIVFTSVPIIVYSLFDKELEDELIFSNPNYYKEGIKNVYFNKNVFLFQFF